MSIKGVFLLFFLCSVNSALALQCYQCLSITDNDCKAKPEQEKFVSDCREFIEEDFSVYLFKGMNVNDNIGSSLVTKQYEFSSNVRCGTIVMTYSSLTLTKRLCLRDVDTCERLNKLVGHKNFTLESCSICNSNLCNSFPNQK